MAAMANDLTDGFPGAPIVGFGTSSGIEERMAALFEKEGSELKVPLPAKSEFDGGPVNSLGTAFAFNEHSQFSGYLIGFGNGEGARLTALLYWERVLRLRSSWTHTKNREGGSR
jgi:hypothetical protein